MKVYPGESDAILDLLVVRGILEKIEKSQVLFDLRKLLVDAELTIKTVLDEALPLEAVKKTGEKK